jgi:hypothetical protein
MPICCCSDGTNGTNPSGYYYGTNGWAPLMGVGERLLQMTNDMACIRVAYTRRCGCSKQLVDAGCSSSSSSLLRCSVQEGHTPKNATPNPQTCVGEHLQRHGLLFGALCTAIKFDRRANGPACVNLWMCCLFQHQHKHYTLLLHQVPVSWVITLPLPLLCCCCCC